MKIAFVQNFDFEYLGVMSISAVLKQDGHEAKAFIKDWERDLIASLRNFDPDVIAFPTYSGSQGWVFRTAKILKKKLKKIIVLGGPHATFAPEIINQKGVDIVCRGEGEYPILELLESLQNKRSYLKIRNLWIKKGRRIFKNPIRPLINPLDRLPLLDREIYYHYSALAQSPIKNFHIGRGCPFACAYCHNSGLSRIYRGLGQYVRNFSPQRVIAEIEAVKEKYPIKIIHFMDDIFITDKRWLTRFLPLYKKKVKLPFVCNVRGGMVNNNLAKKLSHAGCVSVFYGVESGNEELRIKLLKKFVTNKSLFETAKILHRHHILLAANNMMALPGETIEQAFETVKLNARLKVDLPWCAIFQPYPGTEMADYCLKYGFVTQKDLNKIGISFHQKSVLKLKDLDQLVRLQKLFHLGVYFPELIPLLKILIRLPLDPIYDLIFIFNQGLTSFRFYHLRLWDTFFHARFFVKLYFGDQGSPKFHFDFFK